MARISVTVDGTRHIDEVEPRTLLVHYLRDGLGATGTVVGCDTGHCGSCTVLVSGDVAHHDGPRAVKSCAMLAVQVDGGVVTTIEGLRAAGGGPHPVQEAFAEYHAVQCGFCTPGMILAAVDLLADIPDPSEAEVRDGLSGNLCRCTGYHNIVRAVRAAAAALRAGRTEEPDPAVTRAAFVRTAQELAARAEAPPAPGASAPQPAAEAGP
jgi:carbon-monoxide dehydrogenase small subunit